MYQTNDPEIRCEIVVKKQRDKAGDSLLIRLIVDFTPLTRLPRRFVYKVEGDCGDCQTPKVAKMSVDRLYLVPHDDAINTH